MAHDDKTITSQRIVALENIYDRHDQEGVYFGADSLLSARSQKWLIVREARDHGMFHLRLANEVDPGAWEPRVDDAHGFVYRPVDSRMTAEDIEGATYALDTGTAWLFAHCSPHEQVDLAAEARSFAVEQFGLAIARAQVKVHMATNATVKAAAVAKVSALADFAEAVGASVHATVTGAELGHYHRNPHNDHKRDLAVEAIAAVLADWKEKALTVTAIGEKRGRVTADAAAVSTALAKTHTIEWRHERAARLEAEAKAKAKEAEASAGAETQGEGA